MTTEQNQYADITLSSGRVITHRRVSDDALEGVILGDEDAVMTDAEYAEYCDKSLIDTQERHRKFLAERKKRNQELFEADKRRVALQDEAAKHQDKVGQYAISVESQWLGKVIAIEVMNDDVYCKMQGVDELAKAVAGGSLEDNLASNDIQWFAPEDLWFAESAQNA